MKLKSKPSPKKKPKRQSEEMPRYRWFYDTAMEFLRAEPWQRWDSDEHFAVSMPGEEHPWFVSVLGCYGVERGVGLYRGPDAYEHMLILEDRGLDDELRSEVDMVSCSFEPYGTIPKKVRVAVDQSGARPAARDQAPLCFAKQPFKQGRACTLREHEQLALLMRAFLRALEEGLIVRSMKPRPLLRVDGDGNEFSVSVSPFVPPHERPAPPVEPPVTLVDREKLRGLQLLPETWHVGMPHAPLAVHGMDDEIRTLIVVDEASRFVLSAHVVHGEHSARMAALALAKVFGGASFSGRPGLPRTLTVCDRRLFAEVESMVAPLGVSCILVDRPHPALAEAIDGLSDSLAKK
jgi:hypothetical protein